MLVTRIIELLSCSYVIYFSTKVDILLAFRNRWQKVHWDPFAYLLQCVCSFSHSHSLTSIVGVVS